MNFYYILISHEFEQMFSLFQCIKILDYMELSYNEITSNKQKDKYMCLSKYNEK